MIAPGKSNSRGGAGGAQEGGAASRAAPSTILLPLPPTANHMWVHAGSRHFRAPHYVSWLTECSWRLTAEKFPRFHGKFAMSLDLPRGMRGDIDNRTKCALDLLVRNSIVSDDRHCDRLIISRVDDLPAKQCRLIVTEIKQEKEL